MKEVNIEGDEKGRTKNLVVPRLNSMTIVFKLQTFTTEPPR